MNAGPATFREWLLTVFHFIAWVHVFIYGGWRGWLSLVVWSIIAASVMFLIRLTLLFWRIQPPRLSKIREQWHERRADRRVPPAPGRRW